MNVTLTSTKASISFMMVPLPAFHKYQPEILESSIVSPVIPGTVVSPFLQVSLGRLSLRLSRYPCDGCLSVPPGNPETVVSLSLQVSLGRRALRLSRYSRDGEVSSSLQVSLGRRGLIMFWSISAGSRMSKNINLHIFTKAF